MAMTGNPRLRLSETGQKVAEAEVREARAKFFPTVGIRHGYVRSSPDSHETKRLNAQIPGAAISRDENLYALELVLEQPIYSGGATAAQYRAQEQELKKSGWSLEQARLDLRVEVAETFYGVLEARSTLEVTREALAQVEAELRNVRARRDEGRAIGLTVLTAESQAAQARARVSRAEDGVRLAEAAFNAVLDREPAAPVRLAEADVSWAPIPGDAVLKDLLEQSPARRQAQADVRIAEEGVVAARGAGFYPQVKFKGRYELRHHSFYPPRDESWDVGVYLEFPLFSGGESMATLAKASLRAAQARDRLRGLIREQGVLAQRAVAEVREAREAIEVAAALVAQAREATRVAAEAYREGVRPHDRVLQAQTALAEARVGQVQAHSRYRISLARVERTLGGRLHP